MPELTDAEYRHIWRHNIQEDLAILASPAEQLKYQRQAPVDIASEMACTWFDSHYRVTEPAFVDAFSDDEWKSLTGFNAIFDAFSSNFDYQNHPIIEELLQRPDWKCVIEAAKVALTALEKN